MSENTPAGWTQTSAICDDNSPISAIQVDPGEHVVCTFNTHARGNIIVMKQTDPDQSPQQFHFNASYDADRFDLTDGTSNNSGACRLARTRSPKSRLLVGSCRT